MNLEQFFQNIVKETLFCIIQFEKKYTNQFWKLDIFWPSIVESIG